jgi:hypothetical protein
MLLMHQMHILDSDTENIAPQALLMQSAMQPQVEARHMSIWT